MQKNAEENKLNPNIYAWLMGQKENKEAKNTKAKIPKAKKPGGKKRRKIY